MRSLAWPALATKMVEVKSIQMLPHLSNTWKSFARSQTIGTCPCIERHSWRARSSRIGSDSGTGSAVWIFRNWDFTGARLTGTRENPKFATGTLRTLSLLQAADRRQIEQRRPASRHLEF